jgi:hypothetical protein
MIVKLITIRNVHMMISNRLTDDELFGVIYFYGLNVADTGREPNETMYDMIRRLIAMARKHKARYATYRLIGEDYKHTAPWMIMADQERKVRND